MNTGTQGTGMRPVRLVLKDKTIMKNVIHGDLMTTVENYIIFNCKCQEVIDQKSDYLSDRRGPFSMVETILLSDLSKVVVNIFPRTGQMSGRKATNSKMNKNMVCDVEINFYELN